MSNARHVDYTLWILPLDWFLMANKDVQQQLHTDLVGLFQLLQSGRKITRQILLLGVFGDAYIKEARDGRKYIVFKGFAGARPNLAGTRYLLENPKVACFVVGTNEIIKDAAKATRVAVVAYVAIDILQEMLEDNFSLVRLGVNVASDIAKCVLATGLGVAAGALLTVAGTPVVVVFAITVLAGLGGGMLLDFLDSEFHLTERARARMMAMERDRNSMIYMLEHPGETIQRAVEAGQDALNLAGEAVDRAYDVDRIWRTIEEMRDFDRLFPPELIPGASW